MVCLMKSTYEVYRVFDVPLGQAPRQTAVQSCRVSPSMLLVRDDPIEIPNGEWIRDRVVGANL